MVGIQPELINIIIITEWKANLKTGLFSYSYLFWFLLS